MLYIIFLCSNQQVHQLSRRWQLTIACPVFCWYILLFVVEKEYTSSAVIVMLELVTSSTADCCFYIIWSSCWSCCSSSTADCCIPIYYSLCNAASYCLPCLGFCWLAHLNYMNSTLCCLFTQFSMGLNVVFVGFEQPLRGCILSSPCRQSSVDCSVICYSR